MLLTLITLLLLLAVGVYVASHNEALKQGFDQTTPGELRSVVIARLGTPSSESLTCQNSSYWLDREIEKHSCAVEVRYDAMVLPKYWTIGFDRTGRAVAKYEFVSP